jgi:hypothetical protein
MIMRLAIRGYRGREVQFEETVILGSAHLENLVADLATEHAAAMKAGTLSMVEIEFLDDPNPDERFFRIGTDPSGMVIPIAIDLEKL